MKSKVIILLLLATSVSNVAQNFKGLVDIQKLDSTISVELMYAKVDNFVGEKMYSFNKAYLHPKAAEALKKANKLLKEINPNLHLHVYDAARPMRVQQKMWNKVKGTAQQNYVSNPASGGGLHNYGLAVDVTIADSKGDTLPMGTAIDALTSASHIDREEELVKAGIITKEAATNRLLLRAVMKKAGFCTLRSEWWHFNYTTRADARKNYKVIL